MQTNGAGGSQNIAIIGPGIWELDILLQAASNYNALPAGGNVIVFLTRSPAAGSTNIFVYTPHTDQISIGRRFTIAFPGPVGTFFAVGFNMPVNGVGETFTVTCSVIGSRLG